MINELLTNILPPANAVFFTVLVILFIVLLCRKAKSKIYLKPWKVLFGAVLVGFIETILTILYITGIYIAYPKNIVYGILEIIVISLFIYMLLLQKEHVAK